MRENYGNAADPTYKMPEIKKTRFDQLTEGEKMNAAVAYLWGVRHAVAEEEPLNQPEYDMLGWLIGELNRERGLRLAPSTRTDSHG